jgi:hypothetical protein
MPLCTDGHFYDDIGKEPLERSALGAVTDSQQEDPSALDVGGKLSW